MKASPIKIHYEEMLEMYKAIQKYGKENPDAIVEFTDFADYTNRALKRLADGSHGDVIYIDKNGSETVIPAVFPGEQKI